MKDKELQTFRDFLFSTYSQKNSGTANSYVNAIKIIDELFLINDIFNLKGRSVSDIRDPFLIEEIVDFVDLQEDLYKLGDGKSFFGLVKSTQTSYPRKGFCKAAIHKLRDFVNQICCEEATDLMINSAHNGAKLSSGLLKKFQINDQGTDREVRAKRRVGQDIFRAMLMKIYESKCCITGIEIPEVLRASHIISWADNKKTRLNPENGLCLSATYDAAFDKHLITLDEDYRLVLSPMLKEAYTSKAFKEYFINFEGKAITLPSMYKPSQVFLAKHRSKLIV